MFLIPSLLPLLALRPLFFLTFFSIQSKCLNITFSINIPHLRSFLPEAQNFCSKPGAALAGAPLEAQKEQKYFKASKISFQKLNFTVPEKNNLHRYNGNMSDGI